MPVPGQKFHVRTGYKPALLHLLDGERIFRVFQYLQVCIEDRKNGVGQNQGIGLSADNYMSQNVNSKQK
jgi:hypothetical protein